MLEKDPKGYVRRNNNMAHAMLRMYMNRVQIVFPNAYVVYIGTV